VLQTEKLRVELPMGLLEFFFGIILSTEIWPWGRHSLSQKLVRGLSHGGQGGRCVGLTNLPPSCTDCIEIWKPQTHGVPRAHQGLYRDSLYVTFTHYIHIIYIHINIINSIHTYTFPYIHTYTHAYKLHTHIHT
jgi:hypothetical protein